MTPTQRTMLQRLADADSRPVSRPAMCAGLIRTGQKVDGMVQQGWAERVKLPHSDFVFYRITDAGRAALDE